MTLIYNLDPFFTLIFARIFLNEKIGIFDTVLIFVSFVTVTIISYGLGGTEDSDGEK